MLRYRPFYKKDNKQNTQSVSVFVTYFSYNDARMALNHAHNSTYNGFNLNVEWFNDDENAVLEKESSSQQLIRKFEKNGAIVSYIDPKERGLVFIRLPNHRFEEVAELNHNRNDFKLIDEGKLKKFDLNVFRRFVFFRSHSNKIKSLIHTFVHFVSNFF